MSVPNLKQRAGFALLLLVGAVFFSGAQKAEAGPNEILVAVATNFTRTMQEIADRYAENTGIKVQISSGATGLLYAQIVNNAPFDLFLAADGQRPALLHEQGLCDEPFVFARGRVVLWSAREDLAEIGNWQQALLRGDVKRIGVANPATAPYGEAAMAAMKNAGMLEKLADRLVYGQNVGQAFQYAEQGAADLAFVALSLALSDPGRGGKTWFLPEALPILQKGCVLRHAPNRAAAEDFIAYLGTRQAAKILNAFGYE